jgi:beta-1,4-mannosyl-glycoprotein beta-1,4-N-acetylglucosaminyltransferase
MYPDLIIINRKIIDCFTFYNELELLEYRLNLLKDVVDYFVLVESTYTHSGNSKILYFDQNKDLFKDFNIIHIIVDDFPFKENPTNDQVWMNEKFQRNSIKKGLDLLNLNDRDIITITDLDEITDPNILLKIRNNEINIEIAILQLDFYYFNLECKLQELWNHSKIISFKKFKEFDSCETIRHYNNVPIIKKAGWHLSYFGTPEMISNKIKNFSHQEYNSETYTDISTIKEKIENGKDLYGRNSTIIKKIKLEDNDFLPPNFYNTKKCNII